MVWEQNDATELLMLLLDRLEGGPGKCVHVCVCVCGRKGIDWRLSGWVDERTSMHLMYVCVCAQFKI